MLQFLVFAYLILLSSWLKLDDCLWLGPPWFNYWFSLALAYSVGIYCHEPSLLFHHNIQVDYFYDGMLMELVRHYVNRTLIVSCTRHFNSLLLMSLSLALARKLPISILLE